MAAAPGDSPPGQGVARSTRLPDSCGRECLGRRRSIERHGRDVLRVGRNHQPGGHRTGFLRLNLTSTVQEPPGGTEVPEQLSFPAARWKCSGLALLMTMAGESRAAQECPAHSPAIVARR